MVHKIDRTDISTITTADELSDFLDEVAQTGSSRLLVRGSTPLAIVSPVNGYGKLSRRKRVASAPEDDPILGLIGIIKDAEPTDIARYKDQYIAEAIERRGE